MKILIIILVLSAFLFFIKVKPEDMEEYNVWLVIKGVSLISMIISFILVVIKW